MSTPRVGIVIATTREGRFGDKAGVWTRDIAAARGDMDVELLDLRDYPMPFFNERAGPAPTIENRPANTPETRALNSLLAETASVRHFITVPSSLERQNAG